MRGSRFKISLRAKVIWDTCKICGGHKRSTEMNCLECRTWANNYFLTIARYRAKLVYEEPRPIAEEV